MQTTLSRVKGGAKRKATAALDEPQDARLLQIPGAFKRRASTQAATPLNAPGTALRRASLFWGHRVAVKSLCAPEGYGTLLDPQALPVGPMRAGYHPTWDSHPFVQFSNGQVMAIPRELIDFIN